MPIDHHSRFLHDQYEGMNPQGLVPWDRRGLSPLQLRCPSFQILELSLLSSFRKQDMHTLTWWIGHSIIRIFMGCYLLGNFGSLNKDLLSALDNTGPCIIHWIVTVRKTIINIHSHDRSTMRHDQHLHILTEAYKFYHTFSWLIITIVMKWKDSVGDMLTHIQSVLTKNNEIITHHIITALCILHLICGLQGKKVNAQSRRHQRGCCPDDGTRTVDDPRGQRPAGEALTLSQVSLSNGMLKRASTPVINGNDVGLVVNGS